MNLTNETANFKDITEANKLVSVCELIAEEATRFNDYLELSKNLTKKCDMETARLKDQDNEQADQWQITKTQLLIQYYNKASEITTSAPSVRLLAEFATMNMKNTDTARSLYQKALGYAQNETLAVLMIADSICHILKDYNWAISICCDQIEHLTSPRHNKIKSIQAMRQELTMESDWVNAANMIKQTLEPYNKILNHDYKISTSLNWHSPINIKALTISPQQCMKAIIKAAYKYKEK